MLGQEGMQSERRGAKPLLIYEKVIAGANLLVPICRPRKLGFQRQKRISAILGTLEQRNSWRILCPKSYSDQLQIACCVVNPVRRLVVRKALHHLLSHRAMLF